MVLELAKSAIEIKLNAKVESPIISAFEYCYACGFAFSKMKVSEEEKERFKQYETLHEIKQNAIPLFEASDVWGSIQHGERLKSLLLNCRVNGAITEDARTLLDIGYNQA